MIVGRDEDICLWAILDSRITPTSLSNTRPAVKLIFLVAARYNTSSKSCFVHISPLKRRIAVTDVALQIWKIINNLKRIKSRLLQVFLFLPRTWIVLINRNVSFQASLISFRGNNKSFLAKEFNHFIFNNKLAIGYQLMNKSRNSSKNCSYRKSVMKIWPIKIRMKDNINEFDNSY